jgi:hypothetical protein
MIDESNEKMFPVILSDLNRKVYFNTKTRINI